MKSLALPAIAVAFLFGLHNVNAQYPQIHDDIKAQATQQLMTEEQLSDAAWQKALPIVQEWEAKGKPYIPGAAKPSDLPQATIPAFPGAWGGGMYSFGGRGGRVIVVTNLNDSGPGSFRDACERGGPRFIIFNVAGIIRLTNHIHIRAPYVTIAGNTAPGDGVCIAGNTVEIDTHDVVIRHMRFRRGETWVGDRDDSLGGNPVGNIMIDHVSASWGLDECMSIYRHMYQPPGGGRALKLPTVNITIQDSIFSEALNTYSHAFGSTIGGLNSTFHHDLWACNGGRNPSVGMFGDFTFVNNTLFNWLNRSVDGGDQNSYFTIQNNYLKPGPATPTNEPVAYRLLKPESERNKNVVDNFGKAYVAGNIVEGNKKVTKDNWDGGVQPEVRSNSLDVVLLQIRTNAPYAHAPLPIQSAKAAYKYDLANAGATLPHRDPIDLRIIKTVRTGKVSAHAGTNDTLAFSHVGYQEHTMNALTALVQKGIITNPAQVGGYPEYKGTPYKDSDGDGMPDDWEIAHGLNTNDPSDALTDLNGDGYSNIEEFINGTDPRAKKVDHTNLKYNVDKRNAD
ncbi:MAG TPA: polysaccharide lyase [Verrucomicrobiae bacterium]|nr:polysaccharide lyase [Verrucomicrobiae bacterium]